VLLTPSGLFDQDVVQVLLVIFGHLGLPLRFPSNALLHRDTTTAVSKGPIALGKLAFVELPQNWEKKDLPKLLKMLTLALGDEGEEQTQ